MRTALGDRRAPRRPVDAYVAVLAACAVALLARAATGTGGTDLAGCLLVLALLLQAQYLRVRFHYRGQTDDLNFFESALAVAIAITPAGTAVLLAAGASLLVGLAQRIPPVKTAFNVAQWTLATAAGAAVYGALHGAGLLTSGDAVALVLAVLVVVLVNQLAMSGVLWLASGHPLGARPGETVRIAVAGRAVSAVCGLSVGLLLATASRWSPYVLLTAFVPLQLLHWASRGYAASRADQLRLAGLQRVTHALSASLDVQEALERFVVEVRDSFEVDLAEVWLVRDRALRLAASAVAPGRDYDWSAWQRLVVRLAAAEQPSRLRVADGGPLGGLLVEVGVGGCLAVPLRANGRVVGLVCTADRIGLEGFEDGETAVLEAMAAEVTSVLHRAELIENLMEERRTLGQIVDTTSDGIFTVTADGEVASWNDAMARLTGRSAIDMVGSRRLAVLGLRDPTGAPVPLQRWADPDVALPADLQVLTADGETVWLSCSYSPVTAGDDVLVVVARNVTQARELERLKDDFVAVVSHELRSPLAPIKGWAATLLSRGDRMSAEQRAEGLTAIARQAQRLEQLVLNILEASRIEAGHGDPAADVCDLAAVVARLVEECRQTRPDREVRLSGAEVPVPVHGREVWIERAVANLVTNALKYSPASEPVDIRVGADAVVTVTDRGPGIRGEDTERVFGRFERLRETETQTGTGLGLYITRQLARAMGGAVGVDSVPGAGSTFWLRLRPVGTQGPVGAQSPDPVSRRPDAAAGRPAR